MKKRISVLVVALVTMVCMVSLTGCGGMPYEGMDLSEYIKVGQYKGIEAEKISVTVEKSEIADEINSAREAAAKTVELKKGDTVKEGDTVNIDYVGKIDGKKFEGGSAEGTDLELGSGQFIDGFETGLVDHKVGEKNIELNLAFPLNYQSEELQGKDAVFTVTINSATRTEEPDYNLDFVKTQGDYKTTEEYEKAVEKNIYTQKKAEANDQQQMEIWNKVLAKTKVKKYPEDMVDMYVETINDQIAKYSEAYGYDEETIMAQMFGVSSQKGIKKIAKSYVKEEMLAMYIADKEELTYTDKEAEEMQASIEQMGYDDKTIKEETGRTMEECVHMSLIQKKVLEFLQDNADIK
ncbi:MAG: trigger factor [Firmicutes bacterium]|nr:trigger factor [Bacillota bacterium]